jgi:hypothetical protein
LESTSKKNISMHKAFWYIDACLLSRLGPTSRAWQW